jgi:hypothetical protein
METNGCRTALGVVAFVAGMLPAAPAAAWETQGVLEIGTTWRQALEQRIRAQIDALQPGQLLLTHFWQVGNGAASVDPIVVDPADELALLVRPTEDRPLDPRPGEEPVLALENMAFRPAVVLVPEGGSVLVRIGNPFDHALVVEAVEPAGGEPVALEDIDAGRAYRARFKTKGLYVVRCRNFSFLRGYVLVESGAFRFVRPDATGAFTLGDLPEGEYKVTVFNASQEASSAPTPVANWVASSCSFVVRTPAPQPAPPTTPAAEPETPARPPRRGEPEPPPTTPPPPPPPPQLRLTVRLEGRGAAETLECQARWSTETAAPTPAAHP